MQQKDSIISTLLMLVKNGVDKCVVPSERLNDDRVFIYPNR